MNERNVNSFALSEKDSQWKILTIRIQFSACQTIFCIPNFPHPLHTTTPILLPNRNEALCLYPCFLFSSHLMFITYSYLKGIWDELPVSEVRI